MYDDDIRVSVIVRNIKERLLLDNTKSVTSQSQQGRRIIGNLYLSSFEECKQGEYKTVDYSIFIAAHNAFKRAGDYENMKKSESLFPSITDIFTEEYTEGQSIKIDCWINESVILRKRPEN